MEFVIEKINKEINDVCMEEANCGQHVSKVEPLKGRLKRTTSRNSGRAAELFRNIRRSRSIQVCFLVDATASMMPHMEMVRKAIKSIVEKLKDSGRRVAFPDAPTELQTISYSFIAYRDHSDAKQFEVLPFTTAVDEFKTFNSNIRASGAGEEAVNVFGALEAVLKLKGWSPNYETKLLFHICAAPCHGREFHSGVMDKYPEGDPKGRSLKRLFFFLREKGVQYYFGKVTEKTDIMIKKFEEAYGDKIVQFDINEIGHGAEDYHTERTSLTDTKELNWASLSTTKGAYVSFQFPTSIKAIIEGIPLERKQPKPALIKIGPKPFSQGKAGSAFYGFDMSSNNGGVLKEYLPTDNGSSSSRHCELANEIQTIASFLAEEFVKELEARTGVKKTLKFVKITGLAIKTENGCRYLSCERRFTADDKFVRFTNNEGDKKLEENAVRMGVPLEFVQLVMAFSHWTFKATNGFLMVEDLEGVVCKTGVLLTDPAIHCKDRSRYGARNQGQVGMKTFFALHECNKFCKDLKLV